MKRPRLGFVGLGWIGAMRLEAVAGAGTAEIAAVCDSTPGRLENTAREHGVSQCFGSCDELIGRAGSLGLDGLVIATPNALHAEQALAALESGLAVFCQKPLALNAQQARQMVDAARKADRLLGSTTPTVSPRVPAGCASGSAGASSAMCSASTRCSTTPTDRTSPGASIRGCPAVAP